MDIIQQCFEENSMTLTDTLQSAGLSYDQARSFLLVAGSCTLRSRASAEVGQVIADLISDQPGRIMNSIDLRSLAHKLDLPIHIARSGMLAIIPVLSPILRHKKDAIVDTVIALAWRADGHLTEAAKKIFH